MNGSSTVTPSESAAAAPRTRSCVGDLGGRAGRSSARRAAAGPRPGRARRAPRAGRRRSRPGGRRRRPCRSPRRRRRRRVVRVVRDGRGDRAAAQPEPGDVAEPDAAGRAVALDDGERGRRRRRPRPASSSRRRVVRLRLSTPTASTRVPAGWLSTSDRGGRRRADVHGAAHQRRDGRGGHGAVERRARPRRPAGRPATPAAAARCRARRSRGRRPGGRGRGSEVLEAVVAGRVRAGEQQRVDLRHAGGDREPRAVVDVPAARAACRARGRRCRRRPARGRGGRCRARASRGSGSPSPGG